MSKSKSHPCKHPITSRLYAKDIPATFTCRKCSQQVDCESGEVVKIIEFK